MRIITLSLLAVALLFCGPITAQAQVPEGFTALFNGKNLAGWDGNPAVWSVQDGAITGQTTAEKPIKKNTFILWKNGKVADFELRLKFRMEGGNTGVQYRSKDKGDWVVNGYQADFDAKKTYAGILYEEGGRGILANVGQKVTIGADGKIQVTGSTTNPDDIRNNIKEGDWTDYTISAHGNHLQHIINGKVTVDVTDEQEAKRAMEGILAFQAHAGPPMKVQFKDIYLKELK
jgi:hypothetical protein